MSGLSAIHKTINSYKNEATTPPDPKPDFSRLLNKCVVSGLWYFDATSTNEFTGDQYGCRGHVNTVKGYMGADDASSIKDTLGFFGDQPQCVSVTTISGQWPV